MFSKSDMLWFMAKFHRETKEVNPPLETLIPESRKIYVWRKDNNGEWVHDPSRVLTDLFVNVSAHCHSIYTPIDHYNTLQRFIEKQGGHWESGNDCITFDTEEDAIQFRLTWS
jgi:hypothetical protein